MIIKNNSDYIDNNSYLFDNYLVAI